MDTPITPLESHPELAKAAGGTALAEAGVLFKREDLHPYGSHKGRSIPIMIDRALEKDHRRFAISSSGNAALAAALYVRELNAEAASASPISLDIFIGNHIAPHKAEKLKALASEHIRVLAKERPLQALTEAVNEGAHSLRQSTDDDALIGYRSLAEEIAQAPELADGGAVFIGTSSGTTAQALAAHFAKNAPAIQVHIVQTSSCHPMAQEFEAYGGPDEASAADAIVDRTALRKPVLVPLVKKTGGRGWIATNDDIRGAQELASEHAEFDISPNSALSLAGLMQAAALGYEWKGPGVCMICGD